MKAWLRQHLALIGYLFLTLGIVVGFFFLNQSRIALCNLREDLNDRIRSQAESVDRGVDFLRKHPNGAFGFSRKDIQINISAQRRSLENSKRTRRALGALYCGKVDKR